MGSFFLYIYIVDKKFPKQEKLKSTKTISTLFSEGKTYTKFPIKVFFLPVENRVNLASFAVPKRNFKSAVDRNRVKRQLREAYRINKHLLNDGHGKKFAILFLFLGKEKPHFAEVEKSLINLLKKLNVEGVPKNS